VIVEDGRLGQADLTILVEFLVAVVRWKRLTKAISDIAGALGPLPDQSNVGSHHIEGQHQARLYEPPPQQKPRLMF
jgi:hypothetical protein